MATTKQQAAFQRYVNLLKKREAEAARSGKQATEKKLENVVSKLTKSKFTGAGPKKKGGKKNG